MSTVPLSSTGVIEAPPALVSWRAGVPCKNAAFFPAELLALLASGLSIVKFIKATSASIRTTKHRPRLVGRLIVSPPDPLV
jgi:hypothetical protein